MSSGIVAINKPCNFTSSDVVIKCRNAYFKAVGQKVKCGHMGTLDPNASGVLLIGFGKATKLFDFMLNKTKIYEAEFVFGKETDTLDACGKVVAESHLPKIDELEYAIKKNIGIIQQVPPNYSAKSVNGKRAYDLAREGKSFELAPKSVYIESIEILKSEIIDGFCNKISLKITCGSGTYIRSLARDIAQECKCVGYMHSLVRTKCGGFSIENSVDFDSFIAEPKAKIVDLFFFLKKYFDVLDIDNEEDVIHIKNGCEVACSDALDKKYYVVTTFGKLLGLAEVVENNKIKVVTNLWE